MKTLMRSTLLMPIVLFPLVVFAAGDPISRDIPVKYFDQVEIGGAAQLNIVQAETPALRVTTTVEMMERIKIEQSGDRLHLEVKTGKWSWFMNRNHDDVLFEVQMPELKTLSAGGASKVKLYDMQSGDLRLQISGASHLSADKMTFGDLNADISGASHMKISALNAETIHMDLSGASGAMIGSLQAHTLKLGLSGASHLKVSDTGQAEYVTVDVSGASKYQGKKLIANHVKANASGASRAEVHAQQSLEAGSSGASHINYSGEPAELDIGSPDSITPKRL
jgi:hypothetical protein